MMWDECHLATSEAKVRRRGLCLHMELFGTLCYNKGCAYHTVRTYGIYYGFPIDLNNGDLTKLVTQDIPDVLRKYGTIYNPYLAFSQSSVENICSHFIARINDHALKLSDIAVFYFDPSIPTIGVTMEINSARKYNRDFVIFTPEEFNSVYFDMISKGGIVVHSLDELDSTLHNIVHSMDDSYLPHLRARLHLSENKDEAKIRSEKR